MLKEEIQIVQLKENPLGIGIFPILDQIAIEHLSEIADPHRHDHYCCFFVESGYISLGVDFQDVEVVGPALLVCYPGQVHQFKHAKALSGWVVVFDARFLDANARAAIEQSFAQVILVQLSELQKAWFASISHVIYSTANNRMPAKFHHELMQSLVSTFFYQAVNVFQAQEDDRVRTYSSRGIEISKKFQQLVKNHFIQFKKPSDYASKMSITVSYLNDAVKSTTGFPSTYFIQHEILREAQRLLYYTNKGVKEIAYQLGYEDYRYFIGLFSKTIGVSPSNFRKNNRS